MFSEPPSTVIHPLSPDVFHIEWMHCVLTSNQKKKKTKTLLHKQLLDCLLCVSVDIVFVSHGERVKERERIYQQ